MVSGGVGAIRHPFALPARDESICRGVPTPIDPQRLPGLKKALAEFGEQDRASQKQLAELYGVAPSRFSTLTKTRFPDFPDGEKHSDKTLWYPARAAVASMIRYMEDTARGKAVQAKRHSAVMGRVEETRAEVAAAEPEVQPLTAAELDRLASAQTRIWRLKKEQGMYVLASEVQRIARGVNAMLTREVMNLVNELDPNGELKPLDRQRLTNKCREIVLKMHDLLGRFLEDDDDAGRTGGAAIARTGSAGNLRRRGSGQREGDMVGAA